MCGAVRLNSDLNETFFLVQERTVIQVCTPFCQDGLGFFVILALLLSVKKCELCYHTCSRSYSHLLKCGAALVFYY